MMNILMSSMGLIGDIVKNKFEKFSSPGTPDVCYCLVIWSDYTDQNQISESLNSDVIVITLITLVK